MPACNALRYLAVGSLALGAWLAVLPSWAGAPPVEDLVKEATRQISRKMAPEAVTLLRQALAQAPEHAQANYQIARAYGFLRAHQLVCDFDAYRSTIVEHLNKALRGDPKLLATIRKDPMLEPVHDALGYQRLLGLDPAKPAELKLILQRVSWYGPCPGAYGPSAGLRFLPRGRLVLWQQVPGDREGPPLKEELRGTWRLEGAGLRLTIEPKEKGGARETFPGRLTDEGRLELEGGPGPFGDDPCDCEA